MGEIKIGVLHIAEHAGRHFYLHLLQIHCIFSNIFKLISLPTCFEYYCIASIR